MPLRIGSLTLESNLFLAPLAGYTNLPLRLLIRELGCVGLCTTDLVNARALTERNPKALELIASHPADRPLAVQLYGAVAEELRDAALLLQQRGVDVVDINMGCPVRKICRSGSGAALLGDWRKAARLVQAVAAAVNIPVTCKMRLGWDAQNITAPDLARAVVDAGAAAVTVHGRTRQQGFAGPVNRQAIRAVVEAVPNAPVIANGDITTPEAALQMFTETGCAALSIGRGALFNPWIFRHTAHYLASGELLPAPTLTDRLAWMTRHLDLMVEVFGEERGCMEFRKIAREYARAFGPAKEFVRRVVHLRRRDELAGIIAAYLQWRRQFEDESGTLRVSPLAPSLPVPSGPNARW